MKDNVEKAQRITETAEGHIRAGLQYLSEERRTNAYGAYRSRWQMISILEHALVELRAAKELLRETNDWPTLKDYDEP